MEGDLDCVANLIGLQTIASVEEHEGSRLLFLFEQLTHLDRSACLWHLFSHICMPIISCAFANSPVSYLSHHLNWNELVTMQPCTQLHTISTRVLY